jgi:hypothetical protein
MAALNKRFNSRWSRYDVLFTTLSSPTNLLTPSTLLHSLAKEGCFQRTKPRTKPSLPALSEQAA